MAGGYLNSLAKQLYAIPEMRDSSLILVLPCEVNQRKILAVKPDIASKGYLSLVRFSYLEFLFLIIVLIIARLLPFRCIV